MPPPSTEADREATAGFLMKLRGRISDLAVLRALEATPRTLFTPRRYRDLAFREMHLPIACGQSMPDPFFVARLASAAAIGPEHRVLEIGAGSGYCTAIFAQLAAEVLSLERWRALAIEAALRLENSRRRQRSLRMGRRREIPAIAGRFDRIIAHALCDADDLAALVRALTDDGALLAGKAGPCGEARLVRLTPGAGQVPVERDCGPARRRLLRRFPTRCDAARMCARAHITRQPPG